MARPPKPTSLKLVTGNPGKRALDKGEPDPDYLVDLTPPAHLSAEAAAVWSEVAPKLRKARLLTEVDTVQLEMLCVSVANYRTATAQVGDRMVYTNPGNGAKSTSPWAIIQSMAFKQVSACLTKFGMSPADRARVTVNPQGGLFDDPADAFFKSKK
jgi:P27 family predicted phage terminase small subunit